MAAVLQKMMSGGPSTSSGTGGDGTGESDPHPEPLPEREREAAWDAFYEWAAAQCWGPACETSGAEQ
jgi:hypothetical protein